MSDSRSLKQPLPLASSSAFFAAIDSANVRGGCDDCDAYQVIRAHAHGARVYMVTVYYDGSCPWLVARQPRGGAA